MVNWEALGAVAELAGAIGVIASLLYLGSQLRRNSASIEAATALSISESTQQRLLAPAQTPELAEAFSKMIAGQEVSAAEPSTGPEPLRPLVDIVPSYRA